ncbi:MAG: sugar kinase [Microbacteriaceae bacterium]|jgi:sugar/nucleoside kinase (ribokinase family)|nr:sugar kinase [Microbacteriaceae bacterium]
MRLVSVGNIIVDVLLSVPALPERGGDMLATSGGMSPGGSFNTLVAATRQGLRSAYAGGHGTGPMGDLVRSALAREGIELLSERSDADTGFDVAMIDAGGERSFVTAFGAEAQITSLPGLEPGDLVHVSGYGLLPSTNAAVVTAWLDTVDATVLLDPGPLVADIRVLDRVKRRTTWLSCNEREAALVGDGWDHTVVRLGPDGCLVDGVHVPGFPADAVDTNGAGDAHVGAFLAALAARLDPLEAARRANACAAIAVSRSGPSSSPTAAEVDALLE